MRTFQSSHRRRTQTTRQLPCVPSQEATLINHPTSRCSCPCSRGNAPPRISFFISHETQNHDHCRSLQKCAQYAYPLVLALQTQRTSSMHGFAALQSWRHSAVPLSPHQSLDQPTRQMTRHQSPAAILPSPSNQTSSQEKPSHARNRRVEKPSCLETRSPD